MWPRPVAGTCSINQYQTNFHVPCGGMKASGIGRKFALEGIAAYRETKSINL